MTNVSPEPPPPPPPSTVDLTQEIRFAVVMYGGSSLAVYMNGVAQELLRLVRATALTPLPREHEDSALAVKAKRTLLLSDGEIKGQPESVYRKLGRMLRRGKAPVIKEKYDSSDPVFTRFVIDILSGTSAGGINAVFLAKALVNDQDITPLKEMWRKEGDIGVLINDKESDADINLGPQDPPRSLLNSRRMYYKLLDALQGMDKQPQPDWRKNEPSRFISPFVEDLDLFTTATDIRGMEINIPLADSVARERRHLSTFNFRFSPEEERNDFEEKDNPFLAFAARVTSAHPAPFEPMKLSDIDEALNRHQDYRNGDRFPSKNTDWQRFYEDYLKHPPENDDTAHGLGTGAQTREDLRKALAEEFRIRPFSDGGVLDNSPFSFAINQLQFRHTQLPVDRKLLYIEPVPEHPEKQRISLAKPDAIENGWLSLSTLPRYQFIRDDLLRLLERNRLVTRVNRILTGVVDDEISRYRFEAEAERHAKERGEVKKTEPPPSSSYEFGSISLDEMIKRMGSAWGGYQRLRVGETTDELVKVITNAAGFDEDSSEFVATRLLVSAWRETDYHPRGPKAPPKNDEERAQAEADPRPFTQNWFLYQYDLLWRLRRLKFVMSKIDDLACFDDNAFTILRIKNSDEKAKEKLQQLKEQVKSSSSTGTQTPDTSLYQSARDEMHRIRHELSDLLSDLQMARHQLLSRARGETQPDIFRQKGQQPQPVLDKPLEQTAAALKKAMEELEQHVPGVLKRILDKPTTREREAEAESIYLEPGKKTAFDNFKTTLYERFKAITDYASAKVRGTRGIRTGILIQAGDEAPADFTPEILVRRTLFYFYENFDRYDMISYPILYATKVGEETDVVEIYRVSPEDARVLIPEEDLRERKLAGTSIGNFGAFFYEPFRTNDLLWGRLDGADRIITALLASAPPPATKQEKQKLEELRIELIKEVSLQIIADELKGAEKASLRGLLVAAMTPKEPGEEIDTPPGQFINSTEAWVGSGKQDLSKMQQFLRSCLSGRDPLDDFKDTASFDHQIPTATMLQVAARGSKVFGKMLEGIADAHRVNNKRVAWFTRLTGLFWGLVEVAVPGSISNLVFRHWLKLLYLFEALLVIGGTLLLNPVIQQFGFIAFAVTGMIHVLVLIFSDMMAPDDRPRRKRLSQKSAQEKLGEGAGIQLDAQAAKKLVKRFEIYDKQHTPDGNAPDAGATDAQQKRAWPRRAGSWLKRTLLRPTWKITLTASIIVMVTLATLGLFFVLAIYGSESASSFVQNAIRPDQAVQLTDQAGQVIPPAQPTPPTQSVTPPGPNNFRLYLRWSLVAVVVLVFLGTMRESLKALFKEKRGRGVRILGILAALLGLAICYILATNILSLRSNDRTLPGNLNQPALALEMARSPEDVVEIENTIADINYGGKEDKVDKAREELRNGVTADFYFIVIYTLINLWFCYWLSQRYFRRLAGPKARNKATAKTVAVTLAILAAAFALLAAFADVWENLRLYDVLNEKRSPDILATLRTATLLKWGAAFTMIALLSALFLRGKSLITSIGVLFLVIFGVGLYGILVVPQALEWAFALMGVGMIASGLLMTIRPSKVIDGLRTLPESTDSKAQIMG